MSSLHRPLALKRGGSGPYSAFAVEQPSSRATLEAWLVYVRRWLPGERNGRPKEDCLGLPRGKKLLRVVPVLCVEELTS